MDRNSLIGFALISLVLVVFYFINKPTPAELEARKLAQDSILHAQDSLKKISEERKKSAITDTVNTNDEQKQARLLPEVFQRNLNKKTEFITLENNLLRIKISTKGAKVVYAELKKYKTFNQNPLILLDSVDGDMGYQFVFENQVINSSDLNFEIVRKDSNSEKQSVVFRFNLDSSSFIEHIFTMYPGNYMLDFDVTLVGFDDIIPRTISYIDMYWKTKIRQTERLNYNSKLIGTAPTIHYRYKDEKPEKLSENKDVQQDISLGKIEWVAFKQHFFTQTLISTKNNFLRGMVKTEGIQNDSVYQRKMEAILSINYAHKPKEEYHFNLLYAPNHFKTLSSYHLKLENQINLGKGIIRWINVGIVIPTFNILSNAIGNYGLIILLLTIIIKVILLPLTYRSYLSTAKMRILKPEIDAIKEKVGKDAAKLQAETMKLYRSAGVSPMGGCLPMLLQMPVLIALFRFFPASIELRQESFLWAKDLSTYDSIWNFPNNFSIPFYGDHVSLFTILMTISTLIYTRMNSKMMGSGNDAMAKQMQILQYIMPIMFLGFFNNYSAGLSYYYFLANIFTFGQQYLFKIAINENKLRQRIEENKKKKSSKPKSKWQQRLEELQKQQSQRVSQSKK